VLLLLYASAAAGLAAAVSIRETRREIERDREREYSDASLPKQHPQIQILPFGTKGLGVLPPGDD
jgi:hypothetical protein